MGDFAAIDQHIGIAGFKLRLLAFMLDKELADFVVPAELNDNE